MRETTRMKYGKDFLAVSLKSFNVKFKKKCYKPDKIFIHSVPMIKLFRFGLYKLFYNFLLQKMFQQY